MVTMHDAMETCADNAMAVQRTTPVYTQPPDYAREHGELDKYRESNRLNVLCKEAIEQAVRDNYRDNRLDADAVWRDVTAQFGSKRAAFVLAMTCLLYTSHTRIAGAPGAFAPERDRGDNRGHKPAKAQQRRALQHKVHGKDEEVP